VHTGNALSFVLDIADLYKAEFTIPLAFDLAAQGLTSERDACTALRDAVVQGKLLPRIVADIKRLLVPDLLDQDLGALWDDGDTVVAGGRNWSATDHLDVIPETPEPPEETRGPDEPAAGETAP
jgi:CRISPR-associated protein Cas1